MMQLKGFPPAILNRWRKMMIARLGVLVSEEHMAVSGSGPGHCLVL